jgi:hypothetical protein
VFEIWRGFVLTGVPLVIAGMLWFYFGGKLADRAETSEASVPPVDPPRSEGASPDVSSTPLQPVVALRPSIQKQLSPARWLIVRRAGGIEQHFRVPELGPDQAWHFDGYFAIGLAEARYYVCPGYSKAFGPLADESRTLLVRSLRKVTWTKIGDYELALVNERPNLPN